MSRLLPLVPPFGSLGACASFTVAADYLYPETYFAPIELPQPIRKAVLAAV